MRSIPIPQEVSETLMPLNPFTLRWGDGAETKLLALTGPDKEIAERLLNALIRFPPDSDHFDILNVANDLGTLGYTVEVASGVAKRVTITARYRQAFRDVTIRDIQASHRAPGKLKASRPKKKGGSHAA